MTAILADLTTQKAKEIGDAAYRKVLAKHTYSHRAEQLEQLLYSKVKQTDSALA